MRTRRLRYLAAVLTKGPAGLRVALDCLWNDDSSWVRLLAEDLEWMRGCLRHAPDINTDDTDGWFKYIRHNTSAFLRQLNTAWRAHVQWRMETYRISLWQRALAKYDAVPQPPQYDTKLVCYQCDETFDTVKAWRRHRSVRHMGKIDAQRFAIGSVCYSCGTDFHTRTRLVYHLRYRGSGCLHEISQKIAPMEDEEMEQMKQQDAQYAVNNAQQKVPPAQGPPTGYQTCQH